jgi:hypothetical protein
MPKEDTYTNLPIEDPHVGDTCDKKSLCYERVHVCLFFLISLGLVMLCIGIFILTFVYLFCVPLAIYHIYSIFSNNGDVCGILCKLGFIALVAILPITCIGVEIAARIRYFNKRTANNSDTTTNVIGDQV